MRELNPLRFYPRQFSRLRCRPKTQSSESGVPIRFIFPVRRAGYSKSMVLPTHDFPGRPVLPIRFTLHNLCAALSATYRHDHRSGRVLT